MALPIINPHGRERQRKAEGRPLIELALDKDLAPMRFNHLLHDGETKAKSVCALWISFELVEDSSEPLRDNAGSGIPYPTPHGLPFIQSFGTYDDLSMLRIANRIGKKILENLRDEYGIGEQCQIIGDTVDNLNGRLLRQGLKILQEILDQRPEIELASLNPDLLSSAESNVVLFMRSDLQK